MRGCVGAELMTTCSGLVNVSLKVKYLLQYFDAYKFYRMPSMNYKLFCCSSPGARNLFAESMLVKQKLVVETKPFQPSCS